MENRTRRRIVVAVTGATGAAYGIGMLSALGAAGIETHLVMSRWAEETIRVETGSTPEEVKALATHVHAPDNLAAAISSGSFRTDGMVVAPCSMKTLAAIRSGYAEGLVARAADVTIKEGRKLVLLARETPLSPIHLENMLALARIGVVIMPPVPSFYTRPNSVEEIVAATVGRVLDQFGIDKPGQPRWSGHIPA